MHSSQAISPVNSAGAGRGAGAAPRLAADVECRVCGASGASAMAERAEVACNVRAFASERFRLWRCASCCSIHALDEVDLDHYYANYPFLELALDWRLRPAYEQQLLRLRAAGLRPEHRLLDYGCGSGAFVRFLRSRGYDHSHGFDAYRPEFSGQALLAERYDCVLSQDVLEHVADPQALLERFHGLARPGGLIAIGTPNAAAIDLARAADYRHTLHAPYHRHIFSRAALVAAGERRGWSLVEYHSTQYANTLVPFLNSRFYLFFMRTQDDTLDGLLGPPRLGPCLRRLPEALYWGFCGAYAAEETDIMALFRRA